MVDLSIKSQYIAALQPGQLFTFSDSCFYQANTQLSTAFVIPAIRASR
jgi:hypothetical protein